MKILNYNIITHQLLPSKQIALKNIFVKDILNVIMRDKNIFKVFELDSLYKEQKNLNNISNIIKTNTTLMNLMSNMVQGIPNKEMKRLAMPISMTLQDIGHNLYKQLYKQENFNNINSLLLLHCPYPKIDKLLVKYINTYSHTQLEYKNILKQLKSQYPTIDIRKFFFLGLYLDPENLFPILSNKELKNNRIPIFINALMSICIWGIHILFEDNNIKHIMFFNPYGDILIFYYRKHSSGCSKVDVLIALPYTDEIINNSNVRMNYINKVIKEHY